jgi:hypothetical protein
MEKTTRQQNKQQQMKLRVGQDLKKEQIYTTFPKKTFQQRTFPHIMKKERTSELMQMGECRLLFLP